MTTASTSMSRATHAGWAQDTSAAQGAELVVIGELGPEAQEQTARAGERAAASVEFHPDVASARTALGAAGRQTPRCILVDSRISDAKELISWVRGEAWLFSVPVIMQVPAPTDTAYNLAHAAGADEVIVTDDADGLTRRLANLESFDPSKRPPLTQGRAIVAHDDGDRRRVLGRILRQAGFEVVFAADDRELARVADDSDNAAALMVVADELPQAGGLEAIGIVRAQCDDEPAAIVLGDDSRTGELQQQAAAYGRLAVSDENAPADNLLFLANELLRPDVQDVRASTRMLYGTICAFRPAGALDRVYGLTYNISREGLFVRTLDPPPPGAELWFEMRPPHSSSAVHLRGRVVWKRGLSSPGGAAPPGFGIRIDEQACPPSDLGAYREHYQALHDERRLTTR